MHSTIFSFNDSTEKNTQYTEDKVFEMMKEQRKLDGVKEVTDKKGLRDLLVAFMRNNGIYLPFLKETPTGFIIHMPYDALIDAMYQACDDLGEYWVMNDGYEMVTLKDYFRILLNNHMGEAEFDMKFVQAWDYHY